MIELSLKLIDKLIELAKERATTKEKRLALAKVMYSDLTAIHQNYLDVLISIRAEASSGVNMVAVFKHLATESHKLEPLRRATVTIAEVFSAEPKLHSAQSFFKSVSDYFLGANPASRATHFSYLLSLANDIHRGLLKGPLFRKEVIAVIDECLMAARKHWANVSAEYGTLIAKSL